MKKIDEIMRKLGSLHTMLKHIEIVTTEKAVKLEQALASSEEQVQHLRAIVDDLAKERNALLSRLRRLLQSETIRLFDEKDGRGYYVRDIKRLDIYGIHKKIREHEKVRHLYEFEMGTDALAAPGGKMITFPDDNVRVKDLTTNIDILVAHDYIDVTYPGGAKVRFRPEEMKA